MIELEEWPSRSVPASSAGILTFLVADVRGYTHFTAENGDEAAARLASAFARICKQVVGTHGSMRAAA
jgi:class 3 adenylate cyclase